MLDKVFCEKYGVTGDIESMGALSNTRRLWFITLTVDGRMWIVDDYETGLNDRPEVPFVVYHLSSSAVVGGMTFAEVLSEFGGDDDQHRPAQHAMWVSGKQTRKDAARWCGGANTQMYRDFLTLEQSY